MRFKTLQVVFGILLAGSGYSQERRNLAQAACGTELLLTVTNTSLIIGSYATATARVINSPSNFVSLAISYKPLDDFVVSLIETNGTEHRLRPEPSGPRMNNPRRRDLGPGGTYESKIIFLIPEDLSPAVYTLKALKAIGLKRNGTLSPCPENPMRSNPVQVRLDAAPK